MHLLRVPEANWTHPWASIHPWASEERRVHVYIPGWPSASTTTPRRIIAAGPKTNYIRLRSWCMIAPYCDECRADAVALSPRDDLSSGPWKVLVVRTKWLLLVKTAIIVLPISVPPVSLFFFLSEYLQNWILTFRCNLLSIVVELFETRNQVSDLSTECSSPYFSPSR